MMVPRRPTIAVFDSGIGGMTILASVVKKIPGAKYVYFGDTANAPYGPRSSAEILALSIRAIEKLLTYHPDVVVIACNTVTSTSIAKLRERFPTVLFVGVEPAIKPAVQISTNKKIMVAATQATLVSDSYRRLKKLWADGVEVVDLARPEWVRMVEENDNVDEILTRDCQEILATGADVLVLACTHFPFLKQQLQQLLPPIMIIDSADPVAFHVQELLNLPDDSTGGEPEIQWLFSEARHPDATTRERLWTIAQRIQ